MIICRLNKMIKLKKILKNKKAEQGLVTSKLVVLVLVVLVVLATFIFLFRSNLLDFFQNLPGFSSDPGKTNPQFIDRCPIKFAEVKDKEISFCNNADCSSKISSKLLIKGDQVMVYYTFSNTKIGQITRNLIVLDSSIISREGELYGSVGRDLPDYNLLQNLNGAYMHSATEICRDEPFKSAIDSSSLKKIGVVGAETVPFPRFFKMKPILRYTELQGEKDSSIAILSDSNQIIYIYRGNLATEVIGIRLGDTIRIYQEYFINEPDWVSPKGFLKELNGAQIINGEIFIPNTPN